jgi:hypothetical protein
MACRFGFGNNMIPYAKFRARSRVTRSTSA